MGVLIPQVVTESSASGAQIIDGSLKFDGAYLNKTWGSAPTSATTQTFSFWVKFNEISPSANRFPGIFGGNGSTGGESGFSYRSGTARIKLELGGGSKYIDTTQVFRDTGWYHIVGVYDTTQATDTDRLKIYINGERVTDISASSYPTSSQASGLLSNTKVDQIGAYTSGTNTGDFNLTQFYGIDGLALGPGYFGFTDPLTNTWRPKKAKIVGPNDGTVWSSLGTVSSTTGSNFGPGTMASLFDSQLLDSTGSYVSAYSSGTHDVTITFSPKLPDGTKIELFGWKGTSASSGVVEVNGTDVSSAISAQYNSPPTWGDVSSAASGGIQTIKLFRQDGVKNPAISGIRVDGVVLIDGDTSNMGLNGFYLPMDGNSPIGEDQSGRGNNWTPQNFGGSVALDNPIASGALPILNTTQGGTQAGVGVRTDAYHANLVLALPLVGSATDVSNQINSGSTTKTAAPSGALASSAASNFYNGSFLFDGSNDYIAVTDNADLAFGTGNHTVELWVYPNTLVSNDVLYDSRQSTGGTTTGFSIVVNSSGNVQTYTAGGYRCSSTAQLKVGKWSHIAVVRSSGTDTLFMDGIAQADTDTTNGNYTDQKCRIGSDVNGSEAWGGHISDFRLYKGVAKYTSNFVVPATSPDILPDTPSGVSGGSKLAKVTDGAVAFDGTGDFLSLASSTDFGLVGGDWTVECYAYITGNTSSYGRLWYLEGDSSSNIDGVYFNSTQMFVGTTGVWASSGASYTQNKWVHIAVCHDSTNMRIYIDGVQSVTDSNNFQDSSSKKITLMSTNNGSFGGLGIGFISNFRFVKGTAVYTNNFTPPTRELTNVTNTKLLCCQSNTSAIAAAVTPGTITANGNAAATNFNPFTTDIKTVRGQETGYATFNPLSSANSNANFSDGNLTINKTGTSHSLSFSTIGVSEGKWYWEVTKLTSTGDGGLGFGVHREDKVYPNTGFRTGEGIGQIYLQSDTIYYYDNTASEPSMASSSAFNDNPGTFMFAYDVKAGKLYFGKDGQWLNGSSGLTGGNPSAGSGALLTALYPALAEGKTFYPYVSPYTSGQNMSINFGQKPFKFLPPDGFQPINAANVRPETVITRPDHYVGATTYSGTGSTKSVTGVGHSPDFLWAKARGHNDYHTLIDSVRGTSKTLYSNATDSVGTDATGVTSFDRDGFSLGANSTAGSVNVSGRSYVAWTWKAGGNKNTFNVDDVGYANASDVDMSIGSLNSAVYNTSAIWSGMMSGPSNSGSYTSLFDGTDGDAGGYEQPTDGNTLTFTPTGGITATSSIEIYAYQSASTYAGSADITVNGSSIKTGAVQSALGTGAAGGYVNIGTTSLTTLTWSNPSGSNNDYRLMAIKVDGKILVDSNQTPPNVPSIAATGCSVGTKQGFSIIQYTGNGNAATIPHGLSQTPTFLIKKFVTASSNWDIWTPNIGANNRLIFTDAATSSTTSYQNVNASTFDVHAGNNDNTVTMIAYLWHDVPGLQKFGSFEGNENADGPFVELGFKPAVIITKNMDNYGTNYDWCIYDNTRSTINPNDKFLCPNLNKQENVRGDGQTDNARYVDFLSNGFKIRNNSSPMNLNAHTIIYAAWAEAPTVNLFGAQSNAR